MSEGQLVLGIDLGGTDCKFGLIAPDGRVIKKTKFPTEAEEGPDHVLRRIAHHAREVIGGEAVTLVGMGVPGPMSSREGIVYEAPNLGWINIPVRKQLEEYLGLRVSLQNDANAAAYGEFLAGAGRGVQNMVLFTLGTGIGGGIIIDGKLYAGPDDTAGEVGHMVIDLNGPECNCGNRGCLEAMAGALAIKRMVKEGLEAGRKTILEPPDEDDEFRAKVVYDAAVAGDEFARQVFDRVGFVLGVGAALIINLLNPEMLVYSGAMANAGDFIFEPLRRTARQYSFDKPGQRARIELAQLGNDAGIIGAAGLARFCDPHTAGEEGCPVAVA